MSNQIIFVVGVELEDEETVGAGETLLSELSEYGPWRTVGVFDDEEKAAQACVKEKHFYAKVAINEHFPDQNKRWPGAFFPLQNRMVCAGCGELVESLIDGLCADCDEE